MSNKPKNAADFVEAAFNRLGQDSPVLHLMGGKFAAIDLTSFCDTWNGVPDGWCEWAMVEEVHQFDVKKVGKLRTAVPANPFYLERLRLFGPKGDLQLRRDGETFYWHFIGDGTNQWPNLATFGSQPCSTSALLEVEERYYQWRKTDGRVNSLWLNHIGLADEGVYLKQKHYLENGRIVFVRYIGFEEVKNG